MFETTKVCGSKPSNTIGVGVIGGLIFIIFIVGYFALCAVMIGAGLWDRYQYKEVVSVKAAGRIIGASYQNPSFNVPTSAITTEQGTFLLNGVMQGVKGHRVRQETRANGSLALCNEETGVCKKIYPEDGSPTKDHVGFYASLMILMALVLGFTYVVMTSGQTDSGSPKKAKENAD